MDVSESTQCHSGSVDSNHGGKLRQVVFIMEREFEK